MSLTTHDNIQQGSEEWHNLRRGLVTASTVGKLLTISAPGALAYDCPTCGAKAEHPCVSLAKKVPAPIKTPHDWRISKATSEAKRAQPIIEPADNDTSRAITATLVAERLAGFTEDAPMSADMWRGRDAEPYARDIYSGHHAEAIEVGFMVREEDGWTLGYSPDGLVGEDGLIEIKAPRAKTHLLTILAGEVPGHYMAQCQAGLLVSGRKWIDFVSYVGGMALFVKRVLPDPMWFAAIEAACRTFETNAVALVDDYTKRVEGLPVTERIDFDLEVI